MPDFLAGFSRFVLSSFSQDHGKGHGRKISPKRKFWGWISRGHPGAIRDIHHPKARTSTTLRDLPKLRSEKLWAEFSFPKRGVEFKGGVASMTVLAVWTVLAVLESTLPSSCLSYEIQYQEATVTVLTVSAVSAVLAVSVVTATPLKLNPPFP